MAVGDKSNEKSRRERRKEARLEKKKNKFDTWVQHQKSTKRKRNSISKDAQRAHNANKILNRKEIMLIDSGDEDAKDEPEHILKQNITEEHPVVELNDWKRKKEPAKKSKSKFDEYLQLEMNGYGLSANEDLKLEKKLAKKLKVKGGKLPGLEDDITMLLEGLPSALDSLEGEEPSKCFQIESSGKKRKKRKSVIEELGDEGKDDDSDMESSFQINKASRRKRNESKLANEELDDEGKADHGDKESGSSDFHFEKHHNTEDLPFPKNSVEINTDEVSTNKGDSSHSLKQQTGSSELQHKTYIPPHLRSRTGSESEEYAQIRRRIRGLLNRMSESNVESITGEISTIFRSVGRSMGSQIIVEEVLASCSGGPRGNEQYAAVFSAFVAGMACMVGNDFGAKLLASLAKCFEDEYLKEDNLSLRNLTLLLSYLYTFGVCSSELIYDFLIMLSKRLTEVDVSTILTVLQACGMRLRSDDPLGMKNFILNVQDKVNELKALSGEGQSNITGKRMEFMLETICDIKNNKTRAKADNAQQTRIKKWLQKLRVDDILIRGLKWGKLLDPDKKGLWWLSGDNLSNAENIEEVADTIDKDVPETQKMLQLANAQRMNTDARRAIFCIIMSGEDYLDAFEKLIGLDLPGKQDREIMRVLVECCLQEKAFNKYYCVLASKLCKHDKNHKFTLQYCLWDHFKELESMQLVRSMHLAKFVAEMITSFSISIAVLKVVDLSDSKQLTPQRIMHFRMLLEAIFEFPDKIVWNVFTRIATPEYESLRHGIELFVSKYVIGFQKSFKSKFKIARKALNNVEGILMCES